MRPKGILCSRGKQTQERVSIKWMKTRGTHEQPMSRYNSYHIKRFGIGFLTPSIRKKSN